MYNKLCLIGFLIFLSFSVTFAQQGSDWEEEGEIEEAEVIIEKNRQIELPIAIRNYERVPPLPITTSDLTINYDYVEVLPTLNKLNPAVRVLKVKEPPLPKLYSNFIKAGFGNFISPYLEVFANNGRSDSYMYGVRLHHLSSRRGPVDGANSGNSDTQIDLNGKFFGLGHTFFGNVGYQRERYHFYGYAPILELSRDDIKQNFNTVHATLGLNRSEPTARFDYSLTADYHFFNSSFFASENQIEVSLSADASISDRLRFNVVSNLWFANQRDRDPESETSNTINRNLFRVKPYFSYKSSDQAQKGLEILAGANLVYENDTLSNADRLHFYPFAKATYHLNNSFSVYGLFDGDIQKVSLLDLTNENPWLSSNVPVFHTNNNFNLTAGFKGRLSSFVGFNAGLSASNYKNMHFFANSATDSTRFSPLYDQGNVFVFNVFGELNLNSQDRFRTTIRADYYSYNMDELEKPWHQPGFKMSLLSSYNLYDKINLGAEFMLLSGLEGLNMQSSVTEELPLIADLGITVDYIFSPRFSTFLQLKNIFAQNYERYLNYPTRGFMLMGGVTYSF